VTPWLPHPLNSFGRQFLFACPLARLTLSRSSKAGRRRMRWDWRSLLAIPTSRSISPLRPSPSPQPPRHTVATVVLNSNLKFVCSVVSMVFRMVGRKTLITVFGTLPMATHSWELWSQACMAFTTIASPLEHGFWNFLMFQPMMMARSRMTSSRDIMVWKSIK
jgi:hypothetical protein